MDFISKKQGYVPLKVVPYIFFVAVVLSITTTNTFVYFLKLTSSWKSASGDTGQNNTFTIDSRSNIEG